MKKKFLHFQPEYVRKFVCDGSLCNAHCCRKNWTITIDKDTYKKYSRSTKLKLNETFQKFLQCLKFDSNLNSYVLDKGENIPCPMLDENNLCSLQKNFGLEYLSATCQTYPRNIYKLNGIYEWSLTASCPVVAKMILTPEEPMIFEQIELVPPLDTKIKARKNIVPPELLPHIFEIQFAAISILQERTLTIDQRLTVLGFFMAQLQEFFEANEVEKISDLSATYTAENFLSQNKETILSAVKFNSQDFIRILFGEIFPSLYEFDKRHQKYLKTVSEILQMKNSEGNINKVAENYLNLSDSRNNFLQTFSTVFENHLVNEFFTNLYPFNLETNIKNNFGVFIATYKITELFIFTEIYNLNKNFNEIDKIEVINIISELLETIDHSVIYLEKISQIIDDKNIFSVMKSFLQV